MGVGNDDKRSPSTSGVPDGVVSEAYAPVPRVSRSRSGVQPQCLIGNALRWFRVPSSSPTSSGPFHALIRRRR